jgi:phosphatidate cytidylyltransferase
LKNLLIRSLTGVIFIGLVVFCVSYNEYSNAILFLIFSTIGSIEFYKILEKNELSHNIKYGAFVNIWVYTILSLFFIEIIDFHWIALCIPILILLVLLEFFIKDTIPYQNISSTLFALFYITLPFASLNYLSFNEAIYSKIGLGTNWSLLLGYFIILWTNDSAAYATGRLFGRTKLFERVSPKKTWEGFIGGVGFAVLAGYLFSYFTESSSFHWMIMAVIIGVFGTLGDLSESLLKRSGNVKDSGNILPGHGGVLDRFDGILLSAPLIVVYLLYVP